MMKSCTVAVTRMFRHPLYDKTIRSTKKYMASTAPALLCVADAAQAHDETNACGPGDFVRLEQSRPLSRRKLCVARC
jgi:small subunit ribosomal protein S17